MTEMTSSEFVNELFKHDKSIALCLDRRAPKWRVSHITKSVEAYGYAKDDFITGKLGWDDIVHPDDLVMVRATCQDYEAQGMDSFNTFYRICTAAGESVWVSEYCTLTREGDGRVLCTDSIVINYSRVQESINKLEDQVKRQELLTNILQTLHAANTEQSFHIILDQTCRYLQFSRAMLLKDNPDRTAGTAVYEWCGQSTEPLMARGFTIRYKHIPGFEKDIAETGHCIVTANGAYVLSSVFAVHDNGQRYGVLVFDQNIERSMWDEELIQFLEHIVELVSTAVMQKENQRALKASQEHVRRMAYLDHHTQLPNRYRFEKVMVDAVRDAKRTGRNGYVLFIDIDDFKIINDGYGHGVGDKLLLVFAQYLSRHFGNDYEVFRFGGDEFVLLARPEQAENIQACIDSIVKRTHSPWKVEEHTFYCTFSIGVVQYPAFGSDVETILRNADIAMYQAKLKGKSCHVFYSDTINDNSLERVEMERVLRNAIHNNFAGFEVHYQPIVHARSERIKGVEALVRWRSAEGQLVPPNQFIPLAEYLGLIIPIGEYVLREAATFCKKINDSGRPDFTVSINVSVRQIQQQDFLQQVYQILNDVGVNYDNIILEITEGLAVTDLDKCNLLFDDLRGKGIKIAIDDFGTGYSSLNYMREMSVDIIKIDRAFVRDIADDPFSQSFVRLITELGHVMGKQVCIEGVETKAQLAYCVETETDLIQGYFYYKAVPMDDLLGIFHSQKYVRHGRAEPLRSKQ